MADPKTPATRSDALALVLTPLSSSRIKTVTDDEFVKLIDDELDDQFNKLYKNNAVKELAGGFIQANITLTFAVFARKPEPGQEAKKCCKCKADKSGFIICKGGCCLDISEGGPIIIVETGPLSL